MGRNPSNVKKQVSPPSARVSPGVGGGGGRSFLIALYDRVLQSFRESGERIVTKAVGRAKKRQDSFREEREAKVRELAKSSAAYKEHIVSNSNPKRMSEKMMTIKAPVVEMDTKLQRAAESFHEIDSAVLERIEALRALGAGEKRA